MTFLHSSHLAHVFTNVTRTDTTQKSSHTDLGHSKAAGEKGTKHVKRVWQGLTIFKPDLAFLKPGVRHPSFPLQRHKHSFLPVQRPAHQKERRKNEEKNTSGGQGGLCIPVFTDAHNLHSFEHWCCPLSSVAVNDTEPGGYGSDGKSVG